MGTKQGLIIAGTYLLGTLACAQAQKPAPAAADPTAERWSEMTPIKTGQPFVNVRYPHRDNLWDVTFIADDEAAGLQGGRHGIYRYDGNQKLACLVQAGVTTVPGEEATLAVIRGLQIDQGPVSLDQDSVHFIFNATDSAGKRGLYLWSDGKLRTIARTGTTIVSGERKALTSVEYGALHGRFLLYQAAAPNQGSLLVLCDLLNGTDRVLCRSGMPLPGQGERTVQSFATQNWLDHDSVVFRAVLANEAGAKNAKRTMGVYGWFGIKDWSAEGDDLTPERLKTVVDPGSDVPIAEVSAGATFDTIESAPVDASTVVFEAEGEGFKGIFCRKMPDGPLRCIASDHTNFGGPAKGRFTSFGGYPSVQNRDVIFTAHATENDIKPVKAANRPETYVGVFDYRLDSGELFALTDNRFELGGKDIDFYEVASHFGCNDHFAVAVAFMDGSSQVYLGAIPQKFYRKILGVDPLDSEAER